jgi:hypothetical protein
VAARVQFVSVLRHRSEFFGTLSRAQDAENLCLGHSRYHFHAILAAPDLSAVLRDLKSFTAAKILEQLANENREWLLERLRFRRAAHKPNQYQVWQEGSHPQVIADDAMMLQKLEYLHNNPVKRGWVTAPEHWRYSSAHEWLGGAQPLLRCDAWL